MTVDGQLEDAGGVWRLRFSRHLRHPAEKVWRTITEPEHLRAWFPDRMIGTLAPGARLRFESEVQGVYAFEGEVLAFEPPALLELRWGTDTLRFEILPDGDSACTLTLVDTIDVLGKAARDSAGWHECLDRLEAELHGAAPSFAPGERWGQVHPEYVAKFGPEAATIGPPAGM